MPKCIIDGREVEFTPGQNIIEIAKGMGIEIPYFCYHPGLSVVAQCRMCTVEIEKMPKLQTACSTLAAEGMVIKTTSTRAQQNQKSVMEFLLINHPLDCPICDKSGECDLQDYSFSHGDSYSRYTEERRTYLDLDMGPVIRKNMNRCIHCTRCIRFGEEIAGIHEMVAVQRGNNTEITTVDGRALETDYAGNYSDICPTGSLTLKDFRFRKRAWFLKKTSTVCEGCARGCNMEIQHENNTIYRCVPLENMEVNKYWMCDEGRFHYHSVQREDRITEPTMIKGQQFEELGWRSAIQQAQDLLSGKKLTLLVGTDLTQEEGRLLQQFLPEHFPGAEIFSFGTPDIPTSEQDGPADPILKRKSKTSNLHGFEKLGFKPLTKLPSGTEVVLVISGGRAVLPSLNGVQAVGMGVFFKGDSASLSIILPGLSFAEKDGTIVNFQGKEQRIRRALLPLGLSKALPEVLMMWTHRKVVSGAA